MAFSVSYVYDLVDRYSAKLKKITAVTKKFQTQIKKTGVSLKRFGDKVKSTGRKMSSFIGTAAASMALLFPLKASMNFNKSMANVATLIPKSIKRVKSLKKSVQDLAISTGLSTDIMAGGLYQVISAFGDTADTIKILEINAKAAKAGLSTVTDAVNLTSAVMKGYGNISEAAAKKAADLAFQTVKLGQTTFPELAASIGRVTPLAAQLGVSQEQLFAGFATLTGVTGSAAEVSTQLAGTMRALLKPTTSMQKAFDTLGYKSGKAMLSSKGLVGTFKALHKLTGGNEQKMTEMFGRMEPLVAIFSLLGKQSGDYTNKLRAMSKASGAMNEAYREQTEGINKLGHAWNQTKQRMMVFAQIIGDILSPAVNKVIGYLTPLIKNISEWVKNNQTATKWIMLVVGAMAILGPVIIGLGFLISSIGAIIGVVGAIFGVAFLPVTLIIAGIAAAIVGLIFLFKNWGSVMDWLGGVFSGVWSDISSTASELWNGLTKGFSETFGFIGDKIQELISWFSNSTIVKWLSKLGGVKNIELGGGTVKLKEDINKSVKTTLSSKTYNKEDINHLYDNQQSPITVRGQIDINVDGGTIKSSSLGTDTSGNLGFNNPAFGMGGA